MATSWNGNVCIVTGASRGIGRHLCLQLAEAGARVVLAARSADDLSDVASECITAGAEVLVVPTDVSIEKECSALVEAALGRFGRLDTLINNAGISMRVHFDAIVDLDLVERIMRVNYLGSVWCTHHALPHLRQSGGRLAAVASLTALTGVPTRTAYAASKHAMRGFFDSLRIELADDPVSVTVVYPGFVATGIRRHAAAGAKREPEDESDAMDPATCAQLILGAVADRRRELVMTARGKLGHLVRPLFPEFLDRVARRAIEERG